MFNIGILYSNGQGVPKDIGMARVWMQKASDGGYAEATRWLQQNGR